VTWVHPFFLVGLGAAAVPLLLHLLGRRAGKRVELPTIELLRRARELHHRRSRLREILLLLLRTAFVVCVVLAMARPLSSGRGSAIQAQARRDLVLLLDNSLSMSAKIEGRTWWEKAKVEVERVVNEMSPGDRAVIYPLIDEGGERIGFTNDRQRLMQTLSQIPVSYQSGSFAARLPSLLENVSRDGRSVEIRIYTDGTATPWKDFRSERMAFPWRGIDVARGEEVRNHGVLGVEARMDWEETWPVYHVAAQVGSNHPQGQKIGAVLELFLDNRWKQMERKFIRTAKHQFENTVRFSFPSDQPQVVGRVRLQEDALGADNYGYFFFTQPPRPKIVIISGNPKAERRDDASYFLFSALTSSETKRGSGPYEVEEWTLEQLNESADLTRTSMVILSDTGEITHGQVQVLRAYLAQKGRVWIGAGDTFLLPRDPWPLQRMVPFSLRTAKTARRNSPFKLQAPPSQGPLAFLIPRWEKLAGNSEFHRVFLIAPHPQGEIWLRFQNGLPALVRNSMHGGEVMVWLSSFDRTWNNFVLATAYPAFLRQVVRSLLDYGDKEKRQVLRRLAGATIPISVLKSSEVGPKAIISLGGDSEPGAVHTSGWTLPRNLGVWSLAYEAGGKSRFLGGHHRGRPLRIELLAGFSPGVARHLGGCVMGTGHREFLENGRSAPP